MSGTDVPSHEAGGFRGADDPGLLLQTVAESLRPDFEVLRTIGSGKTAHVFLAREPDLQRLVAVKVLRPEVGASMTVRARFEREAHCEAGVVHPCVPSVYRVGRLDSGLPFLVQEFVEGRTLRDRLEARGPVTPGEARRILADIAGALSAAHAQGVIHRDVRPDNVMLRRDSGQAVLMDFGIAAVRETGADRGARLTSTGEILGDPHHSSPELLRGEKVTTETDVYSLGVLGYEILTESNPFGGKSTEELIKGHLDREPVELPWRTTNLDPELGALLKRCLRKEPSRRPRASDLEAALSGEGAGAGYGVWGTEDRGKRDGSILAPFPRLAAFVAELRRRHVYQVAAAYAVVAFGVLEGADIVLEGLSAPDWLLSSVVAVTLAGFPIALVMAWVYDMTSGGIRKTAPAENGSTGRPGRGLQITGLLLSIVVAGALGWFLLR